MRLTSVDHSQWEGKYTQVVKKTKVSFSQTFFVKFRTHPFINYVNFFHNKFRMLGMM